VDSQLKVQQVPPM
jgi:hypothetical protein